MICLRLTILAGLRGLLFCMARVRRDVSQVITGGKKAPKNPVPPFYSVGCSKPASPMVQMQLRYGLCGYCGTGPMAWLQ